MKMDMASSEAKGKTLQACMHFTERLKDPLGKEKMAG